MKLLFDENLSPRLVQAVESLFPGSAHVEDCGLLAADDLLIWNYAAENAFVLITKDSDFEERSLLQGAPPKVVRLAVGNCSIRVVEELLHRSARVIAEFGVDPESSYLFLRRFQ